MKTNVADLKWLGRLRTLPEMKVCEPYPETAQPQNDIVIDMGESHQCYSPEMRAAGFYFREAQSGN